MSKIINVILAIALSAMVAGMPEDSLGSAGSAVAAQAHNYYQFPQSELDAVSACHKTEREARGIPGDMGEYVAWWNANEGTQTQAEWSAAYDACNDRYLWQQGKWNWNAMVRIN